MNEDADERLRDGGGRFVAMHTSHERALVRTDYETSAATVEELGVRHGVAKSTIQEWARDEHWIRRRPHSVDPNDLLARMLGLLDRQMMQLETAMNTGTTESAILAKLVTTLDKVLVLKGKTASDKPRSSKRVQELRAQIAERIGELNKD